MATNANLPAGFTLTQINGARCTAVPKSLTTLTGSLAAQASSFEATLTTSTTAQTTAAASSTAIQNAPVVSTSIATTTSSAIISQAAVSTPIPVSSEPPVSSTLSTTTTSTPAVTNTTTPEAQTSIAAISSASTSTSGNPSSITSAASTASKGTTPTTSSSTPIAVAQSEDRSSATVTSVLNSDNGFQSLAMSIPPETAVSAAPSSTESAAGGGISSNPRLTAAPVVGGVLGSISLIAVVAVLFWFLRKRKRDHRRSSLLTPLTTGSGSRSEFDESDHVAPTKLYKTWRTNVSSPRARFKTLKDGILGIGAAVRSRVVGDRSDTPSVNLNRGNSQFLDGPIPQHSRNNSVLSNGSEKPTVKERLGEFWERLTDKIKLGKNNEPADPFAAARGLSEKQANLNRPPDFSQLLGMDDRELQLQAERRRASFSKNQSISSLPPLGSLGLNFGDNPFADPVTTANTQTTKQQNQSWAPSNRQSGRVRNSSDPFADPIAQPQPSIPKQNTYISDIRRSRGQSIDAMNKGPSMYGRPPSTIAPASRYPSTIAPSRDSYRDTVFSSFSANARKGKGRSDPFDLERPELWRNRTRGASIGGRESAAMYPNPLTTNNLQANQALPAPRIPSISTSRVMSSETYGSKYSSGVESLGGWGDPGPDLGPGSGSSSLRGNAGSEGGSAGFSAQQSWSRQDLGRRGDGSVSPVSFESKASSGNGVGKAM